MFNRKTISIGPSFLSELFADLCTPTDFLLISGTATCPSRCATIGTTSAGDIAGLHNAIVLTSHVVSLIPPTFKLRTAESSSRISCPEISGSSDSASSRLSSTSNKPPVRSFVLKAQSSSRTFARIANSFSKVANSFSDAILSRIANSFSLLSISILALRLST